MRIKEIIDKKDWNESEEFLQSWDYGEFLKSVGRNIKRIKLERDNHSVQIQYIENSLPLGISYVYMPWVRISEDFLEEILKYFKKQKISFVRSELLDQQTLTKYKTKLFLNIQVLNTWILDISKTLQPKNCNASPPFSIYNFYRNRILQNK